MDVVLLKKKPVKSSHSQLIRSVFVPVSFVSMFTVTGVASSTDSHDREPSHNRVTLTPTFGTFVVEDFELANNLNPSQNNLENLALHISGLQAQTKRRKVRTVDFSLSWDNIIAEQQDVTQVELEATPFSHNTSWQLLGFSNVQEVQRSIKIVSKDLLQKYSTRLQILPAGWPLKQGRVSSGFGWRGRRMHKGIDIADKKGTPILAVEYGVIVLSKYMRGYGLIVEIKHSDMYTTRYAHNRKNLVKVGEQVNKGQLIALVGSTGRATGPHVHFEVRQSGVAINPLKYLGAMDHFTLSQNIKLSEYVKLSRK
ncbi:MAG TPA: M23 family metallopeptidase [Thioploca sp.]|nr:MAG: hypothetical protein DRR19_17580 [Gammaproteobacteria bacterium]HDN25928.1 M23 family metallopeptidase [Thioploca sp.]